MHIVEALKSKTNYIRLTADNRWLVWDDTYHEWIVYEHKRYARNSIVLVSTKDAEEAIKVLLSDS